MSCESERDKAPRAVREFLKGLVYKAEKQYDSGDDFDEVGDNIADFYQEEIYEEPMYSKLCGFFDVDKENEYALELENNVASFIADALRGSHEDDMEEMSRRPRGRMLRESSTAMPVHYVIGRELFDDKWWPIIVYLNESPDRYWYEAICADEGGVYHTELGKGYLSRIQPGTDKCAPEVVDAVEDEFFGQFAVDDIPTRRVDTIEDLEEHAPAGKRLISRD